MDHQTARTAIAAGFQLKLPAANPLLRELQFAQAIGYHETRYGQAWLGNGKGSKNWGAVQCRGLPPCDPTQCFEAGDSNPNDDGTQTPYRACFRKYATDTEGAAGLIKELYASRPAVRASIKKADPANVLLAVRDMWLFTYFTGFGATPRERVNNYFVPVYAALIKITSALGEDMPDTGMAPPRTLRLTDPYMTGEDVRHLQGIVGARPDADFGPLTQKAVKAWQAQRPGLGADGVVGPYTWAHIKLVELGRVDIAQPVTIKVP